jgi:membrane protein insertase Oxa1/YidC/SpoIIIJ
MQDFVGYTGTIQLLNDLTTILVIAAPIVAVVLTIIFAIRRSGADEMDQKMWGKRIANTWICCGIAVLSTGLVSAILSYYT